MDNITKFASDDHRIPILIDDTIQCLRFYPSKDLDYLASGGWDSKLRLFEIKYNIINSMTNFDSINITSKEINVYNHKKPILSLSWKGKTGTLFTGCADGSINYVDCQKNIFKKIGEHKYGCREVLYLEDYNNVLITGGWDGALKLWDLRSPNPILSYQFNNKIYTMSYNKNLLVVGLSESIVSYFDLKKLQQSKLEPELIYSSHFKEQIKKISVFRDGNGYFEGSSIGKVAVKFVEKYNTKFDKEKNEIKNIKDFSFRCQRDFKDNKFYAFTVNDISVNPVYGSVCTVGGNGIYSIWDLNKRQRLYQAKNVEDKVPITACEYNIKGDLLAYASGYDWSKGAQYAHLYPRPKIYLHYLQKSHRNGS